MGHPDAFQWAGNSLNCPFRGGLRISSTWFLTQKTILLKKHLDLFIRFVQHARASVTNTHEDHTIPCVATGRI